VSSSDGPRRLRLEIEVGSDDELTALRGALLAARATELGEARRQGSRFAFGYGSETARETMSDTSRQRTLRSEMLDRLIAALESSPGGGR
jgi:hypothetical protein